MGIKRKRYGPNPYAKINIIKWYKDYPDSIAYDKIPKTFKGDMQNRGIWCDMPNDGNGVFENGHDDAEDVNFERVSFRPLAERYITFWDWNDHYGWRQLIFCLPFWEDSPYHPADYPDREFPSFHLE